MNDDTKKAAPEPAKAGTKWMHCSECGSHIGDGHEPGCSAKAPAAQPPPRDVQGEGIADAAFLRSEAEDILGRMQTEENHMPIDPRRRSDLIRRAARLRSIADALLSAWKERDELRALLVDWLSHHDDPCRLDHHGYCQSHYLETDCIVKRTAAALAAKEAAK